MSELNASSIDQQQLPDRRDRVGRVLRHCAAAILTVTAVFFSAWVALDNPFILGVFRYLALPWSWGRDFDAAGMAWGVIGVALFTIIGWIYLEGLELYLPRAANLALAYLFGLALAGFVFECLAIPYHLTRTGVALGLFALLGLLLLRAWLRSRRPPESGLGGGDWREQAMRRALARRAFSDSLTRPAGPLAWIYCGLAAALIAAISFFIFWHALLYPEVYWDSMILYLGYARQTFLAHGFPVKVTGQVGIGLGANYPHLFPVLGSGVAALAGGWSELPQRLMAPLAGLAATVLVYQTALRMTRHVALALTVALLYRATPLGIIYDQYASDYALVLLFTAGFLYLALLYLETGLPDYLAASALLIALAMHLNYLMGILWVPWALTIVLAHGRTARRDWPRDPAVTPWTEGAPWTVLPQRPPLAGLLTSRRFWLILLGAVVVGSTWHVRNWIVTGNPVYAFFYKIFGGKHINDEVMRASAIEWTKNGAGIGSLGDTLAERLRFTFGFFAGPLGFNRDGFLVKWPQYYQTCPLAIGFTFGGVLVWIGLSLGGFIRRRRDPAMVWKPAHLFGMVLLALFLGLLAFHYLLAPFYLYQIIGILPCLALLAIFSWPFLRQRPWRELMAILVLWVGVMPGLAAALMGYKVFSINDHIARPDQMPDSQLNLFPLRHPLPPTRVMYRWRYGDDEKMWEYLNENLKGQRLLTHENRDLALDPSITIVNLDDWTDDWNLQALWEIPNPAERVRQLVQRYQIRYYLRVPNEASCPTNTKMGTADWERLGLAKLIYETGRDRDKNQLYELLPVSDNPTTSATRTAQ